MYDDVRFGSDSRYDDDPYDPGSAGLWSDREPLDRVTHLVLVDGRLVDVWSEPASGTRWQSHADRFDREHRLPAPVAPTPMHERVLAWLDAAVGGRDAVMRLAVSPLADADFEPDPELPARDRELLATTVDLLQNAGRALRVPEAHAALTNAMRLAWDTEPEGLLALGTGARIAAGLTWVVAKANGLLGPGGVTTQAALQVATECRLQLSVPGRSVRQLMAGYWPDPPRVGPLPDLLLLGRPELLTSATRRRLVRARDQALAARSAVGPDVRSA